jgi:hypothetical protein
MEGLTMPKITIETELHCQQVSERIEELAGCLEDTPEEGELIALVLAFEVWETKRWRG